MRTLRPLTLGLGLLVILNAPALAQRPGGPGQGGPGRAGGQMMMQGGLVQILSMPPVVEELGLSDEQTEEVRSIAEQVRSDMMSRMQQARGQFADLSPEERRERFEEMSREVDTSAREHLKDILKPEQMTRLQQIQIQQQGLQAFTSPRVQEHLKLDETQRSELSEVIATFQDESQSLMAEAREAQDRAQFMRQMVELRRSSLDEAMGILTEEQRELWQELTGAPFQMGPGAFGRGGFGPGGRPGAEGRPGPGRRPGQGGRPGNP